MAPERRSARVEQAERVIYAHREWPNRTIARFLYSHYPEMWASVEAARETVRSIRGAKGEEGHNRMANPELIRTPEVIAESKSNPFGFPPSDEPEWTFKPFPVTKGPGLVIADIHLPYHDVDALTLLFEWAKSRSPIEFILIDGDLNDFYQLSSFEKNPSCRNYLQEMGATCTFLDAVQSTFPNAKIILKKGNHERRLPRYISRAVPAMYGIDKYIYEDVLNIKGRGIDLYEYDDVLTVGKLHIIHGDEVGKGSSAVNPARGVFLRTLECVLEAHHHRTSSHTEPTLGGRVITTWSIGALCNIHPPYMRHNKWNHGAALLRVDGNDFEIDNLRVFKKEWMVR